eukprot:365783-Chlamydomonas_euryale.AAC.27
MPSTVDRSSSCPFHGPLTRHARCHGSPSAACAMFPHHTWFHLTYRPRHARMARPALLPDEPIWVRREREREAAKKDQGVPWALYLVASVLIAIAAVGCIFEYTDRNAFFGLIQPDSPLWAPVLITLAVTGFPSAGAIRERGEAQVRFGKGGRVKGCVGVRDLCGTHTMLITLAVTGFTRAGVVRVDPVQELLGPGRRGRWEELGELTARWMVGEALSET